MLRYKQIWHTFQSEHYEELKKRLEQRQKYWILDKIFFISRISATATESHIDLSPTDSHSKLSPTSSKTETSYLIVMKEVYESKVELTPTQCCNIRL